MKVENTGDNITDRVVWVSLAEEDLQALLRVARAAKEYRHSTTNWLMDDGDQEDLVRADGEHLDEALKEAGPLL